MHYNTQHTHQQTVAASELVRSLSPQSSRTGSFPLRLRVALLAATLCASAAGVQAQNAAGESASKDDESVVLDTLVVNGYKASTLKAEETKREQRQVVDAINAQDIGKFPDRSLGESMQRIPGVQISRDKGEVSQVLIRGLPDLVTTINGDEVFTGNGRSLATQDVPVQALAGIEVFKTSSADLQEGGIAGLLNVQLRNPFDFKGRMASASVNYRYTGPRGNSAKATYDPTFGALVSNRWKNNAGEFGLLVDAVLIKDRYNNPVQWLDVPDRVWAVESNGHAYRLEDSTMVNGKYVAPAGTTLAVMPMVGGVYAEGRRKRPMAHMAAQWRVSKDFELHSQLLYTGYRSRWQDDFLFTVTQWAVEANNVVVAADGPYTDTIFGKIGQIVKATVLPVYASGVDPYTATSTQAHDSQTNTVYANAGGRLRMDSLTWVSEVSYVSSRFQDNRMIIDQNVPTPQIDLYGYDSAGHGGFHATSTASANPMADPAQYRLRGLFQSWDDQVGAQLAWRNDVTYAVGNAFLQSLKGGLRLSSHNAKNHHAEGGMDVPTPGARPVPSAIFGPQFERLVPGVDRLGGPFATPDADYLLDNADIVRRYYGLSGDRLPENPNALFNQDENIAALYLSAQYAFKAGEIGFRGEVGVRGARTERTLRGKSLVGDITDASGKVITPQHYEDINIKSNNTDGLPSASLVVQWLPQLQSHFGVGKTIRRPDFGALNPGLNLTPPTINRAGYGSAGNPFLKPIESTNYDGTLEYYFEKNGYIQVSGFYRSLDGYLQSFGQYETINGLEYLVTRPNNSGKGTLKGFEVGAQKFFDFLPEPFKSFGVQANYTHIEGENQTKTALNGDSFVTTDLAGVARENYNAALIYEKGRLSARLALTHRGQFVDALRTARFQFDNIVKASDYVDLTVSYELTKNISLQFDALNLTAQNYESFQGSTIRPRDIRYGSRVFVAGIHWKL